MIPFFFSLPKTQLIFYPNTPKRDPKTAGGQLRIYKRRKNPYELGDKYKRAPDEADEQEEDVEPIADRIVLFRARDVPHEVLETHVKRYAVSMYIPGPAGPGDQPGSHYTKT